MKKSLALTPLRQYLRSGETWSYILVVLVCLVCSIVDVVSTFHSDGWLVIGVIGIMFVVLLNDRMPADFIMTLALAVVIAAGVVDTTEGLAGFSSEAVLSVAVLYAVASGITATGALDYFMGKLLGNPSTIWGAQLRLMVPTAIISAFMNNTPVVAILIPIVQNWSKKMNAIRDDISISHLLMPLSFASILGGTCTLIGTSTNLVVAGKADDELGVVVTLFELGIVGVPVALTGFAYIVLFSTALLPSNKILRGRKRLDSGASVPENKKSTRGLQYFTSENFFVSCLVNPESDAVNRTVKKAKLRGLDGLFLTSVQRKTEIFQAVGPDFVIQAFDILHFSGVIDNFIEFCAAHDFTVITKDNEDTILQTSLSTESSEEDGEVIKIIDENEPPKSVKSKKTSVRSNSADLEVDPSIVPNSKLRKGTFDSKITKVLVRSTGNLPGKTTQDVSFLSTYSAAILSIKRDQYSKKGKTFLGSQLGRFMFKNGDMLTLLLNDEFSWDNEVTARDLKPAEEKEQESEKSFGQHLEREFLLSMKVAENSRLRGTKSLIGQTIEEAGLRGLPGLFLIALDREQKITHAVPSSTILESGDLLWFIGERESVATLRRIPGLEAPSNVTSQVNKLKLMKVERRLVECVISMQCDMLGKTIKEARFRSRYRAAVIAVHRQGQKLLKTIGDIELRPGDVLILDTGPNFIARFRNDPSFLLVAEIENSEVPQFAKFYTAMTALILMMLVVSIGDLPLVVSAVFCLGVMLASKIMSTQKVRDSINWGVIVTIACAFGLSSAMENANVASTIGEALVELAEISNTGEVGILTSVYVATVLLSIVIANNAAALLMFPIAAQAVAGFGEGEEVEDLQKKVLYVLMLAASSSFATPFGYQTNLMVYGPGNYLFKDFLQFGLPMQLWQAVFSVVFVFYLDQWLWCWMGAGLLFLLSVAAKPVLYKYLDAGSVSTGVIKDIQV